jgi:hypothetical protein
MSKAALTVAKCQYKKAFGRSYGCTRHGSLGSMAVSKFVFMVEFYFVE